MRDLNSAEIEEIVGRHQGVFAANPLKRFAPLIALVAVVLYGIYAWSFFSVNTVLERANWDIAGNYLADWIAYEVRPDIEMHDNFLTVEFPRFSPLGSDPEVDWIQNQNALVTKTIIDETATDDSAEQKTSSSGFMTPNALGTSSGFMAPGAATGATNSSTQPTVTKSITEQAIVSSRVEIGDAVIDIEPGFVTLSRGGQDYHYEVDLDQSVTPLETLPSWALQKRPGEKIVFSLGFAGRVEIDEDEVKVRHRFLGWENFLFDTRSPFWGHSLTEVASLIISGPQIEPDRSNLALAWNNIVYNAEWQHGDVWIKLLQTIVMAFMGTLLASIVAFPLAFVAARNITRSKIANQVLKRAFDFLRSVDMLIWALVFTRTFGPGPLAGISAIFFTDTGTFGKLYSEALENIDDKQREGVSSVGASPALVQRFGVVPQVLPVFLSQSLYFWESNTRSATIIGAVGAGGIGLKLWEAMRTNSDWENVAYMVVLILIVVFIFDNISNFLRNRLIGRQARA